MCRKRQVKQSTCGIVKDWIYILYCIERSHIFGLMHHCMELKLNVVEMGDGGGDSGKCVCVRIHSCMNEM